VYGGGVATLPQIRVSSAILALPWRDALVDVVQQAGIVLDQAGAWVVDRAGDQLQLRRAEEAPGKGLTLDYAPLVRRPTPGDPLLKAVGGGRTVVDATLGMGFDALTLTAAGRLVVGVERNPAALLLAVDAFERVKALPAWEDVRGALSLHYGDARDLFSRLEPPDVVLIDPMFPPKRRKSALPPRHIQILRALVGDDPDAEALLDSACRVARQRIVVKRSDDGPPLLAGGREPVGSIRGRTVRFDLYPPYQEGR
jgi:16S rRNA (guanine1516-N2)-methyltransferase